MSKAILALATCLPVLLLTTGCYTTVAVNFGNGTATNIRVRSSETGQEIEVPPDNFKKLLNSVGDLVVTTQSDETFKFSRVAPFGVDRKYHTIRHSLFGPNAVTLNVRLETNMLLFALMPGEKTVDEKVPQPAGYPKGNDGKQK